MNITYTRNGDYLIPNIVIRKTKPIGHYGRLRKAYLEMHRPMTENVASLRSVKVATPPCAAKAAIPCGLAVRKRF